MMYRAINRSGRTTYFAVKALRLPTHGCVEMLRTATLADLKEVASWITSARDCELWAGWRVEFPIALELLPKAIDFREANAFCWVHAGQLVAFGQLVAKKSKRGHLARLIVSPALRGRGYGEALTRTLLDNARADAYERVSLNVDRSNHLAIALYLKLGFRDAKRAADEPDSPGSRYMEKQLNNRLERTRHE